MQNFAVQTDAQSSFYSLALKTMILPNTLAFLKKEVFL